MHLVKIALVVLALLFPGCDRNKGQPPKSTGKTNAGLDQVQGGPYHGGVLASIGEYLVDAEGNKVEAGKVSGQRYLLFYFSAHWCPPCRKFTPRLVARYNQDNAGYQIVFVSSDRSETDMKNYMKETQMPWPGLGFDSPVVKKIKETYGGPGIPCLVMLDDKDNVISHSYRDGNYVGPDQVLKDLDARLKQ